MGKAMPGGVSIEGKGSQETQAFHVGGIPRGPGHLAGWSEGRVEEMSPETLQGSDY